MRKKAVWVLAVFLVLAAAVLVSCRGHHGDSNNNGDAQLTGTVQVEGASNQNR